MLVQNTPYHIPALLKESIDLLVTDPDGIYVDCTMGGGGHTREILSRLSDKGRLIGFDQDADAIANAPEDPRFTFVHSNFMYLQNFLRYYKTGKISGILADLGVSFHHFDDAERGFSFREDAPLDMRMNREMALTAADVLEQISEEELRAAIGKYTDLKRISAISKAILEAGQRNPIRTTRQLAEAVSPILNPRDEKKELAQIFQMLRIIVNGEFKALELLLKQSGEWLKPGGRLAILTYHSGEDRIVKNFLAEKENQANSYDRLILGISSGDWKMVTRKPIAPTAEEIESNPRSRSAKLRVAERTNA